MTTTYYDNSRPDWTPGPLGRDASELARVTASPKGWIYTPAAPNASQIEVIKALRQLDSKITAMTDLEALPTFTASFGSDVYSGGTLTTIAVDVAGTGYATPNTNVGVTIDATGQVAPGTAHATSTEFGLISSFVIDTAGSYNDVPGATVAAGAGVQATGTVNLDLDDFTITNAGTGYGTVNSTIGVTIGVTGEVTPGTVHAISDEFGLVDSFVVDVVGSYDNAFPSVTVDASSGVQATGILAMDITEFTVTGGTGYTPSDNNIPMTISGGGPLGAQATCHGVSDVSGNIVDVVLDTAGGGYTSLPTIAFGAGNGSATGLYALKSVAVDTAGTGYATPDTVVSVTVAAGLGAAATAHATSTAFGLIDAVILDSIGDGYASLPTITFEASPGGGTLATATGLYVLKSITLGNAGTGYGIVNSAIAVTVSGGQAETQATAHGVSDEFGLVGSFVVDTAGAGYAGTPTITVETSPGAGTSTTGIPTIAEMTIATGAILSITLTASEDVNVAGTPSIAVTVGAETRSFVYSVSDSTATALVFKYTVVAGDAALITEVESGALVIFGTYDGIGDVLTATGGTGWLSSVAFTAPSLTNVSVN